MTMIKSIPPKIKICGLTRDCDIDYINEAQPEYIGFVFAPSRRQITPQAAARLRERVMPGIQVIGVFVNETPEQIADLLRNGIIDMAQLHGQETEQMVRELKQRSGHPVIKAMHPSGQTQAVAEVYERYEAAGVDYFLFDSSSLGMVGGTGKTFDWQLIPKVTRPWFLAGGLQADNVQTALALQPYALDISSGAETNGYKDREKILEIVRRIRNV